MAVKSTNIIIAGTTVIPVKLDKATETDTDVRFNLVTPDGDAVKQVYLDENTGQIFNRADLERAYEGHIVDADAIKEIDAECKIDDLDLTPVPISSIPWHYAKATYYVYPDPKASEQIKALYHAFVEAARKEKVAFLTKWTPRSRQAALALTFDGEKVLAVEITFNSDVRQPTPNATDFSNHKPHKAVVDKARQLLAATSNPSLYASLQDEAIDKRRSLVEQVINGNHVIKTPKAKKAASQANHIDSVIADLDAALAAAQK